MKMEDGLSPIFYFTSIHILFCCTCVGTFFLDYNRKFLCDLFFLNLNCSFKRHTLLIFISFTAALFFTLHANEKGKKSVFNVS